MARQTLASSPSPQDFTEKFVRRIDALGRTHSLLSREQWGNVQLCEVARESLEPYILEDKNRVKLNGPPVALDPKSALALGMVFHELATNAMKHGALSNRDGKVAMGWGLNGDHRVALDWQEADGPQVSPPVQGGFGSRLIRLELTHELSGDVELIFDPRGLKVVMSFPLSDNPGVAQAKQGMGQ
jgi:two-component sensor histidine kinase